VIRKHIFTVYSARVEQSWLDCNCLFIYLQTANDGC